MTYDRYYYSILSSGDKKVYKALYEGIQNFETHITVPKSSVSLQSIFQFVGLDNPHLFYVDFTQYSYANTLAGTVVVSTYWYTKQEVAEIDEKQIDLQKKVDQSNNAPFFVQTVRHVRYEDKWDLPDVFSDICKETKDFFSDIFPNRKK